MQLPLQITFRRIAASDAIEARIRKEVAKLERFCDYIMGCRVVVEAPHAHRHQGKLYHVRITLTVPDSELVVSREQHGNHSHEDAYVAVRDAFSAIQRQLDDYLKYRRQGRPKNHRPAPVPEQIAEAMPGEE